MPPAFTFDELMEKTEALGHSPQRTADYLRQYEGKERIEVEGERITKTGKMPYF